MGFYVYEFEFVEDDDGFVLVYPFELPYATQGENLNDAVVMAADILRVTAEESLLKEATLPEPSYGHEPLHGGKVMIIGVQASLDEVETIRASEAAQRLGISRSRVSNLLKAGLLQGYRRGRDTFVTTDSVNERLKEGRKAGRPRKDNRAKQAA
jgi:excisionase family DNA binding protein